jgi:serine/threonine-protein kinase
VLDVDQLRQALAPQYRLERQLGRGGMATVYLAEDRRHHRQVALKVLHPEVAAAVGSKRFLREIKIAAKLTHPHILPLYDSGEAGGFLYYVMPYVEGESLRERLNREKQLPIEDALQMACEVADALHSAHQHGVIHRDIKPENILLEERHAVVADFGIARALSEAGGERLTESGIALGTSTYMSPEQSSGDDRIDGRTDIYSLGCVLYEMLAGEPPFTGPTAESLVRQHLAAGPPSVTVMRPAVPKELSSALRRALSKTTADRYRTAQDFSNAIAAVARHRAAQPRSRRSTLTILVVTMVAVAAGAFAIRGMIGDWTTGGSMALGLDSVSNQPTWVLVADFEGSASLEYRQIARELARTALDQSPVLTTVTDDAIRRGLELAHRPETARLDPDLARELAIRGAVPVVLTGQLDQVGSSYAVLLRVLDADSGIVIVATRDVARDDDQLIPTLDDAVGRLRRELGESRSAIRGRMPLREVATPSLAAYRKYVEANDLFIATRNDREALPLIHEVIELDSGFAEAWRRMAAHYGNLGVVDSMKMALVKGLERPERLTDPVRLDAEAVLAILEWELPNAVRAYRQLARRTGYPEVNFGELFALMGRHDEAVEAYRTPRPFGRSPYVVSLEVSSLLSLGRLEEAWEVLQQLHGDLLKAGELDYHLAAGDWDTAARLAARIGNDATASPALRVRAARTLASAQAARGRVRAAERTLRRALGETTEGQAVRELEVDLIVLALATDRPVNDTATVALGDESVVWRTHRALAAAAVGDTIIAHELLDSLRAQPRENVATLGRTSRVIRAWIAAKGDAWDEVRQVLRPVASWGWSHRPLHYLGVNYGSQVHWLLAEAYVTAGHADSAIAHLEQLISVSALTDLAELERAGFLYPFTHRGLAVLYMQRHEDDSAVEHWVAFLEAFTRPDPEYKWMVDEARMKLQSLREN